MLFTLESLASGSPLVEEVWSGQSERPGTFTSLAVSRSELVVTRSRGQVGVVLRGPESRASVAHAPGDAEFFGITFKLGVFLPALPPIHLLDRHAVLPTTGGSFWLDDHALPIPSVGDADAFVERLIRLGLLRCEPTALPLIGGDLPEAPATIRTLQRRFLQATGLSQRTVLSIERAREAVALLQTGSAIPDVVHDLGYTDQPHLTRTLKQLVGRTPARIVREAWPHSPLSARELAP
ncbi:AraC family transcriptional regulator (plasmid) [Deinococcus aetherius]|uniref:AraC family transcriptional regulator n=1 Tax=Deinococcus aetherius TaxID=200252 RepID=A0ABM8AKS0_9DEIO|nr:helix-turn-helix domain-containing protein [Deinococcus aetherius]BDP44413.1 AraC family transcriptional regulator [Deinococcus aetherius]